MAAPVDRGDLRRVSRREPCPICGKPDYCEVRGDGAVHCMRTASDVPGRARGGGWWHHPPAGEAPAQPLAAAVATIVHAVPAPAKPGRAGADTLDAVYRPLLAACPLSAADLAYLDACGVPEAALAGYGTLPPRAQQQHVLDGLLACYPRATLLTVPGIVERDGRLQLTVGGGLLVAVRDLGGQITALTVRQVNTDGKKRYVWLSGGGGPESGSPAHVALPAGAPSHTVLVTEGVKKAEIAAAHLGYPAIGLAGHGVQVAGLATLERLAEQGALCVLVAFDEDATPGTAALVDASRRKLAAAALAMGLAVRYARWDGALGKGIDDLLVGGHRPRLDVVTAVPAEDDPGGAGRGRPLNRDEKAARYDVLKNIIWSRDLSNPEEPAAAADPGQKLALMLSYEFGGYPGNAAAAKGREVPLGVMATCSGMSRQTFTTKLESLDKAGLVHRDAVPVTTEAGQRHTATHLTPLRRLGFNEKLPIPERKLVAREEAAKRRQCLACGSEAVRVEPVQMERITCTSCGAVHVESPPRQRAFVRKVAYEKRERDLDYEAYVVDEEAEAADAIDRGKILTPVGADAAAAESTESAADPADRGKILTRTNKTEWRVGYGGALCTPVTRREDDPDGSCADAIDRGKNLTPVGIHQGARALALIAAGDPSPPGEPVPRTAPRPTWPCPGCGRRMWSLGNGEPYWYCSNCGRDAHTRSP